MAVKQLGCGGRIGHHSAQYWHELVLPVYAQIGAKTSFHFLDPFASGVLKQL